MNNEEGTNELRGALAAALYRIFAALARLCLRQGVPFEAVADLAKRAFVDVAYSDFDIPGRKQSASRVSLLTGIHRKEIARMRGADRPEAATAEDRINTSAGIISGWRRDRRFTDGRGRPAALPFDDDDARSSFAQLVRRYGGGDVPPRAVLDELVRVGAVTRQKDGRIRLVASAYVPVTTSAEAVTILGSDVADLIAAIDHNLTCEPGDGFFQRKAAYNDLPAEVIDEILSRVEKEGRAVLETLDGFMARRDRETNPKVRGSGRKRAMVGVYCFAADQAEENEE